MAEFLQEIFDIGPGEAVQCLEAKGSVLCDAGMAEEFGGTATLCDRDFLSGPLHFGDYGD